MTGSLVRAIARLFKSVASRDDALAATDKRPGRLSAGHPRLRVPAFMLRVGPSLAIVVLVLGLFPGVVAAVSENLAVTGPALVNTGASDTYTITAMTGSVVDTTYHDTVEIACSDDVDGVVCPATPIAFLNGVATVDVTLITLGEQTITATDQEFDTIKGTWTGTVLAAGLATHIVLAAPGTAAVGVAASVTATAEDDAGATDASYIDSTALTSTGSAVYDPTSPITFAAGAATFDVTFSAIGSVTVSATDPSLPTLSGTSPLIVVGQGTPVITFKSTEPVAAVVGGPTYTVTAMSPSPVGIGFSIDVSAMTVCSITGAVVSFKAFGTCIVDANQVGNANWSAADQVQQSFGVGQGTPVIVFGPGPSSPVVGGPTYTVSATSPSPVGVGLTIDALAASVCSISGNVVSFIATGSCIIDANQDGNANWNAAGQVQQTFEVGLGTPNIGFTSSAAGHVMGGTYDVTTTTDDTETTVALSIDVTTTSVCSISGAAVTFLTVGTCKIDADQAASTNWNAGTAQQPVVVGKADPVLSINSNAVSPTVGGTYQATALSNDHEGAITFVIDATTTENCTVDLNSGLVTFVTSGGCRINALQAASTNWNSASATQLVTPDLGTPILSITSIASIPVVGGTYQVLAQTVGGSGDITLSIDDTSTDFCSIDGSGLVTFLTASPCKIDALEAADANWNSATATQTVTPGLGTPILTITSIASGPVVGGTYQATASPTAGTGAITFAIDPTSTGNCTVGSSTGLVTFMTTGACKINASEAADANWTSATATQTVTPAKGTAVLSITSSAAGQVVGTPYTVTTSTTAGTGAITFAIDPSSTGNCTVVPAAPTTGTVTLVTTGACKINATEAADANWNSATATQTVTPSAAPVVPLAPGKPTVVGLDGAVQVTWTAPASDGGSPIDLYTVTSSGTSPKTCIWTTGALTCKVTGLVNKTIYSFSVTAHNIAGTGPASTASGNVLPRAGATYVPLHQSRIFDTSANLQHTGPLLANVGVTIQVTNQFVGQDGINVPSSATAVTGVVSVSHATFGGYIALMPVAANSSLTSSLNFPTGDARATGVTVPLAPNGSMGVLFGALRGTTDAVFEITGYFTAGTANNTYFALTPNRILDSRPAAKNGITTGPLVSGTHKTFQVTGRSTDSTKVVPSWAVAVTGTLTVTDQKKPGFLSLGPDPLDTPQTSSLFFPVGDNRATGLTVMLGTGGTLSVTFTSSVPGATTNVVFDVNGFFAPGVAGATYVPVTPARIFDTRTPKKPLVVNRGITFPVTGKGTVPSTAVAVTGTLTVTQQTAGGYLSLTKTATNAPTTSTLNFPKGDDRATGVTVPLGPGGVLGICYVPSSRATTTMAIFDVTGYFLQ